MLFPLSGFPLICKSCNLSLKLTEPTSKPAPQYRPKVQSVFHLSVRTASFLVVDKSCYFKMIIHWKIVWGLQDIYEVFQWRSRERERKKKNLNIYRGLHFFPSSFLSFECYIIYQTLLLELCSPTIQPGVRVMVFNTRHVFSISAKKRKKERKEKNI